MGFFGDVFTREDTLSGRGAMPCAPTMWSIYLKIAVILVFGS